MSDLESFSPAIVTTRHVASSLERVFAAVQDPTVLARWWGPTGFKNTVTAYDFRPGGIWKIVMHAPDGTDYPNESRFVDIVPKERVTFEHLGPMHEYRMEMTFEPEGSGTRLTWHMRFADPAEYEKVKAFVAVANEQNFDRLETVLKAT